MAVVFRCSEEFVFAGKGRFSRWKLTISPSVLGFPPASIHDSLVASRRAAMRPKKTETTGSGDLFRARLDQIIDMKHELVGLAAGIDWAWINDELSTRFSSESRPARVKELPPLYPNNA